MDTKVRSRGLVMNKIEALIIISVGITGLLTLVTTVGAGPTIGVIMMLWASTNYLKMERYK